MTDETLPNKLRINQDFSYDEIYRITKEVTTWLEQKRQPTEGMQMRNNVKALLVLQGKQQMLEELIKELKTY
jgi:hypothetical protein